MEQPQSLVKTSNSRNSSQWSYSSVADTAVSLTSHQTAIAVESSIAPHRAGFAEAVSLGMVDYWAAWVASDTPASRLKEIKVARSVIDELRQLGDDWDGYGGTGISCEAANNAEQFMNAFEATRQQLPVPDVSPTSSGTISFSWETADFEAYVEVGKTRFSGFAKTRYAFTTLLSGYVCDLDRTLFVGISLPTGRDLSLTITDIRTSFKRYESVGS